MWHSPVLVEKSRLVFGFPKFESSISKCKDVFTDRHLHHFHCRCGRLRHSNRSGSTLLNVFFWSLSFRCWKCIAIVLPVAYPVGFHWLRFWPPSPGREGLWPKVRNSMIEKMYEFVHHELFLLHKVWNFLLRGDGRLVPQFHMAPLFRTLATWSCFCSKLLTLDDKHS